jgi:hypothetical protein
VRNEILAANPSSQLRVYAVWLPVLRGDSVERCNPDILADSRVVQYWDADDAVGRWFIQRVTKRDDESVEWDAYLLYPAGASWGDEPKPLLSWGRTVLGAREELRAHFTSLLQR